MSQFSPELTARLLQFGHRRLKKAELLLLGKVISDFISIPPAGEPNMVIYTTSQGSKIDNMIYAFSDFIHIPREDNQLIYKTITEFLMWRSNVAYTPGNFMFSGETSTVIDEMSTMTKYVDMSSLCEIAGILQNANHLKDTFKSVILSVAIGGTSNEVVRNL